MSSTDLSSEEKKVIEILREYNSPFADFQIERRSGKIVMIIPLERLKIDIK